jgi:CubicO group peptidase (beta-lactamase class C family)
MDDYRPRDSYAIREPTRSRHAAYEFTLSARDLARVGQLVLQQGSWEGKEVVSPAWLRESLTIKTAFTEGGGYSYLWWIDASRFRARDKQLGVLDAVHDIAATGLGEQLLLVIPALNAVLVHLTMREESGQEFEGSAFELADMILQARRGDPRADAKFGDLAPQPYRTSAPPAPERNETPLAANARDLVGEYQVSPAVTAVIRYIDGGLFIDMPGRGEAELFQEAPDRFFLKVADVVLILERDTAGAVIGAQVVDRGRALSARRVK